jgi:hypothetical protein
MRPNDEVFATRDFGLASYLTAFDVPLLVCQRVGARKNQWVFSNAGGKAVALAQEYRAGDGRALIDAPTYWAAHRKLAALAAVAQQPMMTTTKQRNHQTTVPTAAGRRAADPEGQQTTMMMKGGR